ncbi:MAG: hypothetical protein KAF27_02840 [Porphyrobacter sp.]|nr:hypothetical protein [Porphyrobacter sp.]
MRKIILAALLLTAALPSAAAAQSLGLGSLISDGAVFQRGKPIIVTGTAAPGRKIEVRLGDVLRGVVADNDGAWRAGVPARQAATGLALTATSAGETVTARNLAVCGVFLCLGPSDMQMGDGRHRHAR